jgi:hypothetical protein
MNGRLGAIALIAALSSRPGSGSTTAPTPDRSAADEAAWARDVLAAAHGAPPVLCALAARTLEHRYGFEPWQSPGGVADTSAALAWALERTRGEGALPVLLDGLGNDDACVREFAARLVARIESRAATTGMLRALGAASAGTRHGAAVALGFAAPPPG